MLDILIAEDDTDDLLLFKEALGHVLPAFNIIHASNGLECLEILKAQAPPDVIFLDVRMPLRTGLQCLESIKCTPGLGGIPIIMLSTSHNMEEVDACYRSGATLYIAKPTDAKTLAITLKGAFHMLQKSKRDSRTIENFRVKDSKYG